MCVYAPSFPSFFPVSQPRDEELFIISALTCSVSRPPSLPPSLPTFLAEVIKRRPTPKATM